MAGSCSPVKPPQIAHAEPRRAGNHLGAPTGSAWSQRLYHPHRNGWAGLHGKSPSKMDEVSTWWWTTHEPIVFVGEFTLVISGRLVPTKIPLKSPGWTNPRKRWTWVVHHQVEVSRWPNGKLHMIYPRTLRLKNWWKGKLFTKKHEIFSSWTWNCMDVHGIGQWHWSMGNICRKNVFAATLTLLRVWIQISWCYFPNQHICQRGCRIVIPY